MAPEQAMGRSIDPRSDVYGLGAVLYAAATGRPPIQPGPQLEVLTRVAQAKITPLREVAPHLPPALVATLERALSPRADDRYSTAGLFARDLRRFLESESTAAGESESAELGRRRRFLALLLVGLAFVSIAAALLALEYAKARDRQARVERLASFPRAAWPKLVARAKEIEDLLAKGEDDHRTAEAVATIDKARADLEALGATGEDAERLLPSSPVGPVAVRALERRARGLVEGRTPAPGAALPLIARAERFLATFGGGTRGDLVLLRAEALLAQAGTLARRTHGRAEAEHPGGHGGLFDVAVGHATHRVPAAFTRALSGLHPGSPAPPGHAPSGMAGDRCHLT